MLFGGWQVPRSAVGKLETQESQWCSSSPKGNRLEAQEKLIFPFDSKGRKNLMSQLKAVRQEELLLITGGWAFLFYSGLQLVGWGPPTLGRTICFIQFIDSNVSLMQKHPYRYTQNNVSPNVWALSGANWHINFHNNHLLRTLQDFPGGAVVKNLPANAGDTGSSPGPGRSHMLQSN